MTVMRLLIKSQKTGEDRMEQMIEFPFTLYFFLPLFYLFVCSSHIFYALSSHLLIIIRIFVQLYVSVCSWQVNATM